MYVDVIHVKLYYISKKKKKERKQGKRSKINYEKWAKKPMQIENLIK